MARYRKIDPRIWNDAKFCSFSERGKLLFFYVLTHPNMTMIGMLRATPEGLFSELGFDTSDCQADWQAVCEAGVVQVAKQGLIRLPNFLRYNEPESPSVVKSWASCFDLLPECDLLNDAKRDIESYLIQKGKSWIAAYRGTKKQPNGQAGRQTAKQTARHQEQEQEQDIRNTKETQTKPKRNPNITNNGSTKNGSTENGSTEFGTSQKRNVGSTKNGTLVVPKTVHEEKQEENNKKEGEGDSKTSYSKLIEKIISVYNETTVGYLPKVVALTDKRRKAVRRFIDFYRKQVNAVDEQAFLSAVREYFLKATCSDFLTGNNNRGWKADFDFLTNENKALALIEGKYDNRCQSQTSAGSMFSSLPRPSDYENFDLDSFGVAK